MANGIVLDFDWTPKSVALSYTVNGNTYPYAKQADGITRSSDSRYTAYTTPSNTLLTFTASATTPSSLSITEYKWDFGDGTIGYGATVSHTYASASPQTQVTLVATDSLNGQTYRSRILNLRRAVKINVIPHLRV